MRLERTTVWWDSTFPPVPFTGWASVSSLLKACGPATIFRTIWAVIVDSVQCCAVRPFAHVSEEMLKAIVPVVANVYASAAIVMVVRICCSIASGAHRLPASVFWFQRAVDASSVFQIERASHGGYGRVSDASATGCASTLQITPPDGFGFSAVALTQPEPSVLGLVGFRDYNKLSESLSCQILKCSNWHGMEHFI